MLVGLAAPAMVTAQETAAGPPAAASANQPEEKLEEVVVTGSSIRGAPPVGSNVITVGREAIEATSVQSAQQLLKLVPAITGMGSAGQGAYGSFDTGSGGDSPNIHGLGGVSSSSTLTLIDGHRIPLTGIIRNLADPNILPPNAVERVEVMPEGASSVYGSDAVAGVINFITRKHFDGVEVDAQGGKGDSYTSYSGGFVGGKYIQLDLLFGALRFARRRRCAGRPLRRHRLSQLYGRMAGLVVDGDPPRSGQRLGRSGGRWGSYWRLHHDRCAS